MNRNKEIFQFISIYFNLFIMNYIRKTYQSIAYPNTNLNMKYAGYGSISDRAMSLS